MTVDHVLLGSTPSAGTKSNASENTSFHAVALGSTPSAARIEGCGAIGSITASRYSLILCRLHIIPIGTSYGRPLRLTERAALDSVVQQERASVS